jgi:putative membrane protein
MTVVAWVFALVAAAIHVLAWAWESLLIGRPSVHRGVFGIPTEDVPAIRLWSFNVGFYNLFLGLGMLAGVALWAMGATGTGRTLVLYITAFMALAGVVLFVSDRMALSRERGKGIGGAVGQSLPALIALLATLLT